MRVLIAFASEHGSTKEIAEAIGRTLRAAGHTVDVHDAGSADPTGYDAVVIGSAVHSGAWLPGATEFARRHTRYLASRPTWLFSVGTARAHRGWIGALPGNQNMKGVTQLRAAITPRDYHFFGGVFERDHIPWLGRVIVWLMRGRYGDFRDWAEIEAWADGIARHLATVAERGSPTTVGTVWTSASLFRASSRCKPVTRRFLM